MVLRVSRQIWLVNFDPPVGAEMAKIRPPASCLVACFRPLVA
jgi:hypothetical protein